MLDKKSQLRNNLHVFLLILFCFSMVFVGSVFSEDPPNVVVNPDGSLKIGEAVYKSFAKDYVSKEVGWLEGSFVFGFDKGFSSLMSKDVEVTFTFTNYSNEVGDYTVYSKVAGGIPVFNHTLVCDEREEFDGNQTVVIEENCVEDGGITGYADDWVVGNDPHVLSINGSLPDVKIVARWKESALKKRVLIDVVPHIQFDYGGEVYDLAQNEWTILDSEESLILYLNGSSLFDTASGEFQGSSDDFTEGNAGAPVTFSDYGFGSDGKRYIFGSTSFIFNGDMRSCMGSGDYIIAFWYGNMSDVGESTYFSYGTDSPADIFNLQLADDGATPNTKVYHNSIEINTANDSDAFDLNGAMVHHAFKFDSATGTSEIYINGLPYGLTSGKNPHISPNNTMLINAYASDLALVYNGGSFDEIICMNRSGSSEEIWALYLGVDEIEGTSDDGVPSSNTAPTDPLMQLNFTYDNTNFTNESQWCDAYYIDPDSDVGSVSFSYLNSTTNDISTAVEQWSLPNAFTNVASGTHVSLEVHEQNFTRGDYAWCQAVVNDGTVDSNYVNTSTSLSVENYDIKISDPLGDFSLDEDSFSSFTIDWSSNFTDPDYIDGNDPVSFLFDNDTDYVAFEFDNSSHILTVYPVGNASGVVHVNWTAIDNSAMDSENVTWTVNAINDDPWIDPDSIVNQSTTEDSLASIIYNLDEFSFDVEDDLNNVNMTYGIDAVFGDTNSSGTNCSVEGAELLCTNEGMNRTGDNILNITSLDADGAMISWFMNVSTLPDNDIPWWDVIANTSTFEIAGNYVPMDTDLNVSSYYWDVEEGQAVTNITIASNNSNIDCWFPESVNGNFSLYCNTSIYEIAELNVSGFDGTQSSDQLFVVSSQDTTAPTITFVSQVPADIDVFSAFVDDVNITYTLYDISGIGGSVLWHDISNDTDKDLIFVNGSYYWTGNITDHVAITNIDDTYYFSLDDNVVYPATYNLNQTLMEESEHLAYDLDANNEFIRIQLENVANDKQFGFLELQIDNQTASSLTARFYYCNDSYTTGSVLGTDNCVDFYSLDALTSYNHTHNGRNDWVSNHTVIPFAVSNGMIGDVVVTSSSNFIVQGRAVNGWDVGYINVDSRNGASQVSTDIGISWTNQTYTFDSHLHQYDGTETFSYWVDAYDGYNNYVNSTERYDLIQLYGLPPISSDVYSPVEGSYSNITGNLTINGTDCVSPNNYPIVGYNVSFVDANQNFVYGIVNISSPHYFWDISEVSDQEGYIRIECVDNESQSSYGYSANITIDNSPPELSIVEPHSGGSFAGNVPLHLSYIDSGAGIDTVFYEIIVRQSGNSMGNTTFASNTSLSLGVDNYRIYVYANDTPGNVIMSYSDFNVISSPATGDGTGMGIPTEEEEEEDDLEALEKPEHIFSKFFISDKYVAIIGLLSSIVAFGYDFRKRKIRFLGFVAGLAYAIFLIFEWKLFLAYIGFHIVKNSQYPILVGGLILSTVAGLVYYLFFKKPSKDKSKGGE